MVIKMSTRIYEIADEQRERIKEKLPAEQTGKPGRSCQTTNRNILNGALWIAHTGSQWSELPPKYGKKNQQCISGSKLGKTPVS